MVLYRCVNWHQQLNCLAPKFHCTRMPITLQLASQSFFFLRCHENVFFFKRLQQSQKQPTKSILLPLCLHFYSVSAHTHNLDFLTTQAVLCSLNTVDTEGLRCRGGLDPSGFINPCDRLYLAPCWWWENRQVTNSVKKTCSKWIKHCESTLTEGSSVNKSQLHHCTWAHSQWSTINGVAERMSEIKFDLRPATTLPFAPPHPPFSSHTAGVAPLMVHIFTQR